MKPERAWIILLPEQIKCLRSECVDLLAVCGLFVLVVFQGCNISTQTGKAQQMVRYASVSCIDS